MENIRVISRVKPLTQAENERKEFAWKIVDRLIQQLPDQNGRVLRDTKEYILDQIYGPDSSTQDLFATSEMQQNIQQVVQGFNCTIFAYGQTSSGKTYTMRGDQSETGLVSLCIYEIFTQIYEQENREFLVRISYIELYNEEIIDLLSPNERNLQIRESQEKGVYVAGVREVIVASPEQILEYMDKGEKIRHTGATKMNERSSRSHTIFKMVIESKSTSTADGDQAIRVAVLNLVDLAGSERVSKTGAEGQRLKEGSNINKSLLTLSQVIRLLSEPPTDLSKDKSPYIPFRDSKLTRILQPALGGNAKTTIISCISPSSKHIDETHSTLRFSTQALKIQNKATINEVLSDAALLKKQERQISKLKQQLQESGFKGDDLEFEVKLQELRDQLLYKDQDIERERNEKERFKNEVKFLNTLREESNKKKPKQIRRLTWAAKSFSADIDTTSDDQENVNTLNIPKKRVIAQFDTITEEDTSMSEFKNGNQELSSNRTSFATQINSPFQQQQSFTNASNGGLDPNELDAWLNDANRSNSIRKPLLNITNLASVKEEMEEEEERRTKKRKSTESRSQFSDRRISQEDAIYQMQQQKIVQLRYLVEELEMRLHEKDDSFEKHTQKILQVENEKDQINSQLQQYVNNCNSLTTQKQLMEIKCQGIQEDYNDLLTSLQDGDAQVRQDNSQQQLDSQIQKDMQAKLCESEARHEAKNQQIEVLDGNLKEKDSRIQVILKENEDLYQESFQIKGQHELSQMIIDELKAEKVQSDKSIQNNIENVANEFKQRELATHQEHDAKIYNLEEVIKAKDEEIKLFTVQVQNVKMDYEDKLKGKQQESTQIKQQHELSQQIINELKAEKFKSDESFQNSIENNSNEFRQKELATRQEHDEKICNLENIIKAKDDEIKFFTVQVQNMKMDYEVIQQESSQIKQQHELSQQIIDELKNEKSQSDKSVQNSIENLSIESRQRELATRQEHETQVFNLEKVIKQKDEETKVLIAQIENVNLEYGDKIKAIQQEKDNTFQEKEQVTSQMLQVMKDQQSEIVGLQQQRDNLLQDKQQLEEIVEQKEKVIIEGQKQIQDNEALIETAQNELQELQNAFTQEKENLQRNVQDIQQANMVKVEEIQNVNKADMELVVQQHQKVLQKYEETLLQQSENLKTANANLEEKQKQIEELVASIDKVNQEIEQKNQDLIVAQEGHQQQLQEVNSNHSTIIESVRKELEAKLAELNLDFNKQCDRNLLAETTIQENMETINKLQKSIDELHNKIAEVEQNKLQNEASIKQECEIQKDNLVNEHEKELQNLKQNLNKQKADLKNQLDQSLQSMKELNQSEKEQDEKKISEFQNEITKLNKIVQEKSQQVDAALKVQEQLQQLKASSRQEISSLNMEIKQLKQSNKGDSKDKEIKQKEADKLKQKVQDLDGKFQAEKDKRFKLEHEKTDAERELKQLRAKFEAINKNKDKQNVVNDRKYDNLSKEISKTADNLQQAQQQIHNLQSQVQHKNTDVAQKQAMINELEDKIVSLNNEIKENDKQQNDLEIELENSRSQNIALEEEITMQNQKNDDQQKDLKALLKKYHELEGIKNNLVKERDSYQETASKLQEAINQNEKHIQELEAQNKEFKFKYNEMEEEKQDMQDRVQESESQFGELEKILENKQTQIYELLESNEAFKEQNNKVSAALDSQKQFAEKVKLDLAKLQKQNKQTVHSKESLQKELEIKNSHVSELQRKVQDYLSQSENLKEMKNQNDQLMRTCEKILEEKQHIMQQHEDLKISSNAVLMQKDDLVAGLKQQTDDLILSTKRDLQLYQDKEVQFKVNQEKLQADLKQILEKAHRDSLAQFDLQKQIEDYQNGTQERDVLISTLRNDNMLVLQQLNITKDSGIKFESALQEKTQQVQDLQSKLDKVNGQHTDSLNALQQALGDKNQQDENSKQQFKLQIAQLENQIQVLSQNKLQLSTQLQEQEDSKQQNYHEKQQLEGTVVLLQNQSTELNDRIKSLTQQKLLESQQLQDALEDINQRYQQLQNEMQQSHIDSQQYAQQIQEQCDQMLQEQDQYVQKIQENEKYITKLQGNNDNLQEQLNNVREMNTQNDSDLRKRCENLQQESKLANKLYQQIKEESQEKISSLQNQIQEWKAGQQLALNEIRTNESEIKSLNNSIQAQQGEIAETQRKLEKVSKEKMALQAQVQDDSIKTIQQGQLQELQHQVEDNSREHIRLQSRLESQQAENKDLKQKLQQSLSSNQQSKNNLQQINEEKSEVEKKLQEYFKPKLIEYKQRLVVQGNVIDGIRNDLQKSGGDLKSFTKLLNYQDLEQNYKKLEQTSNIKDKKLSSLVQELENIKCCSLVTQENQVLNHLSTDEKCQILVQKYQDIKKKCVELTQNLSNQSQQQTQLENKCQQLNKEIQTLGEEKTKVDKTVDQFFKPKLDEYKHRLQRQEVTIEKVKQDFLDAGGKYDSLKQVFHYRSIQYSYEEALKELNELKKKYEKVQATQGI